MSDQATLIYAVACVLVVGMLVAGGLRALDKWLLLTRQTDHTTRAGAIGQRIDLADLKERVRRLEAIATGVDL